MGLRRKILFSLTKLPELEMHYIFVKGYQKIS